MPAVDFLVIGTQKGGTKSLYHLLGAHPGIFVPWAYEVGFFALDEQYRRGVEWYLDEYFRGARDGQIRGEVSPQYMSASYAAERIKRHFPEVRLVASLRNPIDRAHSAYRMMVRRTLERRSFEDAIESLQRAVEPRSATEEEGLLGEYEYLRTGFYGRILARYFERFPREHVKVVFAEELKQRSRESLRDVYAFLGVEPEFLPSASGFSRHEGGSARFPRLNALLESRWYETASAFVKPAVPRALRGLRFRLEEWNTKRQGGASVAPALRERLVPVFRDDVSRLEDLLGAPVPWSEFH